MRQKKIPHTKSLRDLQLLFRRIYFARYRFLCKIKKSENAGYGPQKGEGSYTFIGVGMNLM